MRIAFKEALDAAGNLLHNVGPLSDCEPEEFAAEWIKTAQRTDFEDIVVVAKSQSTYQVSEDGHQWHLVYLEVFLEAWAGFDPIACLRYMKPLLAENVGRTAAVIALYAVARHAAYLSEDVAEALNSAAPGWDEVDGEVEMLNLTSLLEYLKETLGGKAKMLDARLTQLVQPS